MTPDDQKKKTADEPHAICGAHSRRTGKPCRGRPMANGRCRMHGGKSTGPRTANGLGRSRRARGKHGYYSRENRTRRKEIREQINQAKQAMEEFRQGTGI